MAPGRLWGAPGVPLGTQDGTQVGLKLAQLGPSWAKLGCQMQALLYKFTRCGSHALLERNIAQHSANMAENSPKMEARRGTELWFFDLFSFLLAS